MRLFKFKCKEIITDKHKSVNNLRKIHHSSPRNAKDFKAIPGPRSLPLIGTLYNYFPVIGGYSFDKLHLNGFKNFKKYGPIVREEIVPGVNIVWLFKPEDIETLFRKEGKYPQRRSHLALQKYRLDKPHVYKTGGLLPTNGSEWYQMRSEFQKPLSSPTAVTSFIAASDQIIQEFLHIIKEHGIEKYDADKDFLPFLSRLFLELTCQSVLDFRLNSFSDFEMREDSDSTRLMNAAFATNSVVIKTDAGFRLWRYFDTPLYRKLKKAQECMEEFAIDRIQLKISLYEDNVRSKKTLLETYLSSKELELRDIIGIVCDFLLAGVDTSSYSTSFIFYHLALNPKVQEKLYQEACSLLPDENTPVTKDILSEAKYAKAVVKESLRLRPVSIGVGRVLNEDIELCGYTVPKGTSIVTQNQISCRLENYVDRPNEFLPDRWIKSSPDYKQYHPFLVLPFGHGSRSCIAKRFAEQNMTILTLRTARMFRLEWHGGDLDTKSYLINKPDGPVTLKFIKRS